MHGRIVFFLLVAPMIGYIAPSTTSIRQNAGNVSISELFKQSRAARRNKDFAKAAQLLEEVVVRGSQDSGLLYDTACWWARAGNKEKAFQFLFRSIQAGYHMATHIRRDNDLLSLHDDSRWPEVTAACDREQAKYIKDHSDPNNARFITSDIGRFWEAYDHAIGVAPKERAAIFEKEYLVPGTAGLKDLNISGRVDPEELAKAIESYPDFYKAIRSVTLIIDRQRAETIAAFRKLKELYPPASFPDTYFVIGEFGGGGTASGNGLLIAAEMFARAPEVPTTELGAWERSVLVEPHEIPPTVAHEMIHFHQSFATESTLLCNCLSEGSADFLGELTSGRLMTRMERVHTWANSREHQLWDEFQKEMDGTDMSHWLYAGSGKGDRPDDLGYWMGYKITESFYRNSTDKKQAIQDLLAIKDCKQFLNASRYARRFTATSDKH